MRPIALLRTFIVLTLIVSIASALAAIVARGRMTSHGGPADDELDLVAIFEGMELASTAPALRRASVTTWYGGGSLDLRDATLDPAGAEIAARAVFGGFRLVVPPTWRVETHGIGIFGGFGDARNRELVDPEGPLLTIKGFALFGGVGIVSEAPDLDRVEPAVTDAAPEATEAPGAVPLPA